MGSSWVYSITAWDVQAQVSNLHAALMKGPDGGRGARGQEPWYVCVDVGTGVFVMAQGGQFVLSQICASRKSYEVVTSKRTNVYLALTVWQMLLYIYELP